MHDHPVDYMLYSDGSTQTNPGIGAYAAILIEQSTSKESIITRTFERTTNNRMEMLGIVEPLEALARDSQWTTKSPALRIHVFSDSKYVVNAATRWINGWKKKSWRSASGKPVKNIDILERIYILNNSLILYYTWVKGHADNNYNNRCDVLARDMLKSPTKHIDLGYKDAEEAKIPDIIDFTVLS